MTGTQGERYPQTEHAEGMPGSPCTAETEKGRGWVENVLECLLDLPGPKTALKTTKPIKDRLVFPTGCVPCILTILMGPHCTLL